MIVEPRALCRFVICCWCGNRGVDGAIPAADNERTNGGGDDLVVVDQFTDNPIHDQEDKFKELIDGYIHDGILEKVDMAEPRNCSYSNKTEWDKNQKKLVPKETVILGEEVPRMKSYTPMPVELRGITLRQLRAINVNIVARCEKEGWVNYEGKPLTPETVTLYDVNKYIVLPFTKNSQASFVETLPSTAGTQPPRFFVSHWWGEPFVHTLACLEQFVEDFSKNTNASHDAQGGGMTEDTPIWICIFANNQWNLDEAISIDPKDSSFTLALTGTCENRVISILDAGGNVFARVWCDFELHLTFTAQMKRSNTNKGSAGLWAVYTAHKHKFQARSGLDPVDRDAVGIISGGTPCDGGVARVTSLRESYFPTDLIRKSHTIKIELAEASRDSDRKHILNSIVRNKNLEADPPTTHPNYDAVNDAVKGAFAASLPILKAAAAAGGEEWTDTLDRLSKGIMTGTFEFYFNEFSPPLSLSQAREFVSHVPSTCNGLNIRHARGEAFECAIEGMIDCIGNANTMKRIICFDCKVGHWLKGGKDAGCQLATAIESSKHATSIEELALYTDLIVSGNVSEWASALRKMTALKALMLLDVGDYISDEEKSILRNATHALDVHFDL